MSAYMIDREHVRYLVNAACAAKPRQRSTAFRWFFNGHWKEMLPGDAESARQTGQMLWDENYRSVSARYPDCETAEDLPGPVGESYDYDKHHYGMRRIEWVQVIKACRAFEYQACEHDGWEQSEAHAFTQSLIRSACSLLPGYNEAEWGAPKPIRPLRESTA